MSNWCEQQKLTDYELIVKAADDLGASALGLSTGGAYGYQQFIESRENFQQLFKSVLNKYTYSE